MYLGLDLGTSGLKALLIADDQSVVGTVTQPIATQRPHSGWVEQDPQNWITAATSALDGLKVQHPAALAAVRGIGLAGHMHGATLLDARHKVLRPCMLWNDTRSHQQAAALDSDPQFRATTGNIVFPGFTAPKLAWVRSHEPEVFAKTDKVLLPKDYLRLWLTGELFCDMSDASGTSWLDVGARDWSDDLLDATQLTRAHMPKLVEGTQAAGQLRPDLAQRWGMAAPIVAGGAGDNAAAAIGLGIAQPGQSFVSLGTSGVLFAPTPQYQPRAASAVHTFCHAIPDLWHQMGVMLSATDALNWWANLCEASAQDLTSALGDRLQPASDATFLPYLAGERTPHNDAKVRGAFIGLDHQHDRAQLTQAVLEGVAYALRDNLHAMQQAGTQIDRVLAVGGGSASHYWLQMIATVLNIPVDLPQDGALGAAFGAARLAMIATQQGSVEQVCRTPEIARQFVPDQTLMPGYEAGYQRFVGLYPLVQAGPKLSA